MTPLANPDVPLTIEMLQEYRQQSIEVSNDGDGVEELLDIVVRRKHWNYVQHQCKKHMVKRRVRRTTKKLRYSRNPHYVLVNK